MPEQTASGQQSAPPGIEPGPLEDWFRAHVEQVSPPLAYEQVAGGRSNLTFRVSDTAGRRWVLRRPPLHSTLPSAHDMGREHRVQAALADTPVPVARMVGHCSDAELIGAEFYVMEHVEGHIVRDRASAAALPEPTRHAASLDLVDTLVALHSVEPDAVGLGDFARREDYIARQLRRWSKQWEAQRTRELPVMDEVHDMLAARIPEQGPARIVHGDYRLDNVLVSATGQAQAVLDWELCTLGDPLADVGALLVYWAQPGDQMTPLGEDAATLEPGFAAREELLERYRAGTGTTADLDFYRAFAYWRLAAIFEGVYARHKAGAYGEVDESIEHYGQAVADLGEEARRLLG